MPFTITISEDFKDDSFTERYKQTVDAINLPAIIQAVNTPPEPVKPPKKRRSDAGKPRAPKPSSATV